MKTLLKLACMATLGIFAAIGVLHYRGKAAEKALEQLLPKIVAITLYDTDNRDASPDELGGATPVPFPIEVFRKACASARNVGWQAVWKGRSLAVIKLSDGTECHAWFSYYGQFFEIHGVAGCFYVPGDECVEFDRVCHQLINEQFVPRRLERNKGLSETNRRDI